MSKSKARENAVLARLADRLTKPPAGEVWVGDDAALLSPLVRPLFASDVVVEGVHVDRRWCSTVDIGFKAVSVNVSDIAAMGGAPRYLVATIAGARSKETDEIMEGVALAALRYECAVVGGDLSDSGTLTVGVAIIGEASPTVVLRSGAKPGDLLYVTGPLGGSAAGLRRLRAEHRSDGDFERAHRRPIARVGEGRLAAQVGVHAMLDCSDGLSLDVDRLARGSRVGVVLDEIPSQPGVTDEEALFGGEDYELIIAAPPDCDLDGAFASEGLRTPIRIGHLTSDDQQRICRGEPFTPRGYEHQLDH